MILSDTICKTPNKIPFTHVLLFFSDFDSNNKELKKRTKNELIILSHLPDLNRSHPSPAYPCLSVYWE